MRYPVSLHRDDTVIAVKLQEFRVYPAINQALVNQALINQALVNLALMISGRRWLIPYVTDTLRAGVRNKRQNFVLLT